MDILPIQGLAVPCEWVFSSSKETMSAWRSWIGPELMEALQLVKFSIRQGHALDFMAKCQWDAELEELEQLITADALVPEDLDFYKKTFSSEIKVLDS